jgi:nucleotide-binding universal stress UspA family protein
MMKTEVGEARVNRIAFKNILYLTDFSEQSAAALPFAEALARGYGASVHALHVLTPVIPRGCTAAIEADEALAADEMKKVEARFKDVKHDAVVAEGAQLWPAVEQAISRQQIDLIVAGTHGRTQASKLLLGSAAEEIFRRSSVPVLTIGPSVRKSSVGQGVFRSILFATDFSKSCETAAPFAVSLAEEVDARLVLLYVAPEVGAKERAEIDISQVVEDLRALVPAEARLWCRPTAAVSYGDPADRILEAATERDADLIVLGVRDPGVRLGAATHLERAIAHKVVAHARCPVLTVRG